MRKQAAVATTATIHEGVTVGRNVTIADYTILYPGVVIGDNSHVGPYCILGEPGMGYYQHPETYENPQLVIGDDTIIRSHSVVYAGSQIATGFQCGHHVTIREHSRIGAHCSVGTYSDIQGHVTIGEYCRFHSSVHIGQYATIGSFVFMYPNTVLTNDPHPPSDTCTAGPVIHDYAVISAGAVLMPGITVGRDSIVGAQSLVTKDVEPEKVMLGVPARPICSIHDLQCKDGRLDSPYPWRNHFSRGMPWGEDQ